MPQGTKIDQSKSNVNTKTKTQMPNARDQLKTDTPYERYRYRRVPSLAMRTRRLQRKGLTDQVSYIRVCFLSSRVHNNNYYTRKFVIINYCKTVA